MSDAEWDVVVVGSGAGGAAAAYGLCERGLSVLVLEAGPRFDPAADYAQAAPDWELRDFPEKPGSRGDVIIATPHLVLAAGAVETPRLLLSSDNLVVTT